MQVETLGGNNIAEEATVGEMVPNIFKGPAKNMLRVRI